MTPATMPLAELMRDGGPARLLAAAAAGTRLRIDCAAAARVPASFLHAALAAAAAGAAPILDGLHPAARQAVEVIDRAGLLEAGPPPRAPAQGIARPFEVHLGGDRLEVRVLPLARGATRAEHLAHEWMRGVSCAELAIDLGAIEHLDSLLVAWLLQLCAGAAPAKVSLMRLSAQAATQLRQLRLDHVLGIA
jgi:hypothetical protein